MPDTPLNPDAHTLGAVALMNSDWGAHLRLSSEDCLEIAQKVLLAVAQPVVNSVEELEALPIGTVVYANNHIGPAERFDVGWMGCGNTAAWSSAVLAGDGLPARVLYRPEVKP